MANDYELLVSIKADIADLKSNLKQAGDQVGKFGISTVALGTTIGNALTDVGKKIISFAIDSAKAYAQHELALTRLTSMVGGPTAKAFDEFAEQLQQTTTFNDDAILALQGQLSTFGLFPGSVKQATKVLLDYAAATGKDLPEAGNVLAQAIAGQSRELKKFGLEVSQSDTKTERMEKTLKFLQDRFGGTAETIKGTAIGQFQTFQNTMEDLQKSIGKELIPIFTTWIDWINRAGKAISDMTGSSNNDLSVKELTIKKLKEESQVIALALRGNSEYRNSLIQTYGVQANNDQFLRNRLVMMTRQIKSLRDVGKQESKTADETKRGIEEVQSRSAQAVDERIAGLKLEAEIADEMQKRIGEITTLTTQKKITDSRMELQQLSSDARQITAITDIETQKRIMAARMQWEANASFSDQLRVKLEQDSASITSNFVNMSMDIINQFGSSIGKMIVEGGRFRDVMKQIWKNLAEAIIAEIARMIAKWLVFMALKAAGGGGFGFFEHGGMVNEPSVLTGLRSGKTHFVGEAGPEMVIPANSRSGPSNQEFSQKAGVGGMGSGGGNGGGPSISVNITGHFLEASTAKWQQLVREVVVPEIRRWTASSPSGPFTRRRGAAIG